MSFYCNHENPVGTEMKELTVNNLFTNLIEYKICATTLKKATDFSLENPSLLPIIHKDLEGKSQEANWAPTFQLIRERISCI